MKESQKLKIVTRYKLSKRDKKALLDEVSKSVGEEIARIVESSENVEVAKVKSENVEELYFVDGSLALVRLKGAGLIPSLYFLYRRGVELRRPSVFVDQGAVPRILNGADVMIPGIKRVEGDFGPGEVVLVRELEKERLIAIGVSLVTSEEIRRSGKGKAVKTLHYLGDEVWSLEA